MADLPARDLAVRRLLRVEGDGAHVARLADGAGSAEAARRASDWVAGVTRQRRWLDFVVGQFYRGDVAALDPELLQALRIGTYDLVVRGVKPHAAVNEAVGTARRLLHRGAAGLANGVLRAVARAQAAGTLPQPDSGDPAEDLAVRHSYPTWMVRRWLGRWGPGATVRFLEAGNEAPRYALRCTAGAAGRPELVGRLDAVGAQPEPSRWLDDFVTVGRLQPVLRGGLVEGGACAVQDEAAGLVVRALDPRPGEAVLDAAAAPGGKAVGAALRMAGQGEVLALDVSEAKARLVRQSAARQGAAIVRTAVADLTAWAPPRRYDRVLLDAPCSGTGVLAKRADLRWNRRPGDLAELAALQDRLLDAAAAAVRPGGLLVYATCSVEPEENEGRVESFLARTPSFTGEPVGEAVPGPFRDGDVYRALPHVHGTDGAFAARLRRSEGVRGGRRTLS
jgi:16S rRNA (cytosine967-C5)-methyltransferase